MVGSKSKEDKLSILSFKLVYKVMIVAAAVVGFFTAILYYFFIQNLSEPRIRQVQELANTTSVVVSELAVSSFYSRDKSRFLSALESSISEANNETGGFLQVSVILYPSGVYYASTNEDFMNKKVGQSLLKKLDQNQEMSTSVEKLNYEFNGRTIPVLHFLRNIILPQNGEEKKVAVTQILFDYEKILDKTRKTLLTVAGLFYVCLAVFVWLLYLPVTQAHKKLIQGFHQIGKHNFDHRLKTKDHGEIGTIFDSFNSMNNSLKSYFKDRQQTKIDSVISSIEDSGGGIKEASLRKTDVTCLCARIPDIQTTIDRNSLEDAADSISQFLEPLELIVKEFGGQIIKILGDKIFIFFEGINSIDNSIRTALKINQKWQIVNHERMVLNKDKLRYGIGLHSEEGIAGTVGNAGLSYTIVGRAATIASYLCTCASSEQILASASLMDKASGSFQHQVVTELKAEELSENEQVIVITNLQFSSDEIYGSQFESKGMSTSEFVESSQSRLNNNMPGISSTNQFDTSIPDMLEETLSSAPLESVAPSDSNESEENQEKEESNETIGSKPKKQSLWDEFKADED